MRERLYIFHTALRDRTLTPRAILTDEIETTCEIAR